MDFDIAFRGVTLFGFEVRFYSVMILAGLFGGVILAQREAKRLREDPAHVINFAVVGAACALVGARLYHVIDEWAFYSAEPAKIFALRSGGIGIFGAIAGAAFAVVAYAWIVNKRARTSASTISSLRWLDIGAPAFLLGQAIGRWGNFFNQELFGPPSNLPWAIPIDLASRPLQYSESTHFHPLFLYESLLSFLGVAALLWIGRRYAPRLRRGDILLAYLVWYSLERSALEFLRIDNWKIGPVPTAHIVAIILIATAVAAFLWWRRPPYLPEPSADHSLDSSADAQTRRSRSSQRREQRRAPSAPLEQTEDSPPPNQPQPAPRPPRPPLTPP